MNVPALLLVLAVAALLISGVRQSVRSNTIMVIIKLAALLFLIVVAATAFKRRPLLRLRAERLRRHRDGGRADLLRLHRLRRRLHRKRETDNPQRNLPIAIVGSLVIATILCILVAVAAVGALPPDQLAGDDSPLATALADGAGIGWGADIVSFGALVAITSVVMTILYGHTRVAYAMCRDGLMPERLASVWEKTRTPVLLTLVFAIPIAILAAFVPLKEIAELVDIGTLFALFIVNIAVIWLRRTKPDMERGFRVPLVPVLPLIGAALCVYLMTKLPIETWLRFGLWLLLGLVIYAAYGYRNSQLRRGGDSGTPAPERTA